jgi:LysR family transcriptional regulator of beta-lactamase
MICCSDISGLLRHCIEGNAAPSCTIFSALHLHQLADPEKFPLWRSYRTQDRPSWLEAAGLSKLSGRGSIFDVSTLMVQATTLGHGIALAPPSMFQRELNLGLLVQPLH